MHYPLKHHRNTAKSAYERRQRRVRTALLCHGILFMLATAGGVKETRKPFQTLPTTQASVVAAYHIRVFTE